MKPDRRQVFRRSAVQDSVLKKDLELLGPQVTSL